MPTYKVRTPSGDIISVEAANPNEARRKAQYQDRKRQLNGETTAPQNPPVNGVPPPVPGEAPPPSAAPGTGLPAPIRSEDQPMFTKQGAVESLPQLGMGAGEALISLAGLPGDIYQMKRNLERRLAKKLGPRAETGLAALQNNPLSRLIERALPTGSQVKGTVEKYTGELPDPETRLGRYARTTGQMAGNAIMPGGIGRKIISTAVPGVLTERAGEFAEGSELEQPVRTAVGIASSVAAGHPGGSRPPGKSFGGKFKPRPRYDVKTIAKEAMDPDQLKAAVGDGYTQLRSAGVQYDQNSFMRTAKAMSHELDKEGFAVRTRDGVMQRAPEAYKVWAKFKSMAESGKAGFDDIDTLRRMASEAAGTMAADGSLNKVEAKFAMMIKAKLDKFTETARYTHNGSMPESKLNPLIKQTRELASRDIKREILDRAISSAQGAPSGFANGLRLEFDKFVKNPERLKGFSEQEKAAINEVATGNYTRNGLRMLGTFGFDFSNLGSTGSVAPVGIGLGTGAALGPIAGVAVPVVGTGAKYGARKMTTKAAERAVKTVLAGTEAQAAVPRKLDSRWGHAVAGGVGSIGTRPVLTDDEIQGIFGGAP